MQSGSNLVQEAAVATRCLSGLRLGTGYSSDGERKGAVEKTVVLETSLTEESLIRMESMDPREWSYVWTVENND